MGDIRSAGQEKLLGLEILRFLSALAVLVWHYAHFAYAGLTPVGFVRAEQPFYEALWIPYEYGNLGVQLFWAISGYIFFWKYRQPIASGAVDGRTFFILRFSRLYPLHFVTLLAVALLQTAYVARFGMPFVYADNGPAHFVLQLSLASNWLDASSLGFNGPIWSISLEVLVYGLFFATLRLVGASPIYTGAMALLGFIGMANGWPHGVFECALFFHLGGLVAILGQSAWARECEDCAWYVSLLLLGAAVAATTFAAPQPATPEVKFALLAIIPPLLHVAASVRLGGGVARMAGVMGSMTYAAYLVQFPLQMLVVLGLAGLGLAIPFHAGWFFLLNMALPLAIAVPVFRYFEKPAQDWLRLRLRLASEAPSLRRA